MLPLFYFGKLLKHLSIRRNVRKKSLDFFSNWEKSLDYFDLFFTYNVIENRFVSFEWLHTEKYYHIKL